MVLPSDGTQLPEIILLETEWKIFEVTNLGRDNDDHDEHYTAIYIRSHHPEERVSW